MIIGIDLGSFKTCVSYMTNVKFDILINDIGQRETQNIVAFNKD